MPKISSAKKDERRRQILQAAATCFAKQGFHRTTILDICTESGLSAGAVYSYFDSKDAIVEALAESGRRLAARRQSDIDGSAKPLDRLKALLAELEAPGSAKVNQYDLRSWAEAIGNRQLRDIYLEARGETVRTLIDIVKPLAAERGLAADALAELVLAVIVGSETRKAIQPAADIAPVLSALFALLGRKAAPVSAPRRT
jgi:AcrR family transcriptional regulator